MKEEYLSTYITKIIWSKKDPSLCKALTSIIGEVNNQANLVFWLTTWHALFVCSGFLTSSHKKGQTLSQLICSVKMNEYWSQYFLYLYGPRWISGHKNTKDNNNLAITEQSLHHILLVPLLSNSENGHHLKHYRNIYFVVTNHNNRKPQNHKLMTVTVCG